VKKLKQRNAASKSLSIKKHFGVHRSEELHKTSQKKRNRKATNYAAFFAV
jgi:hypothetical protein